MLTLENIRLVNRKNYENKIYHRNFLLSAINLFAQTEADTLNVNKKIIDENSGKPMLIGYTTREAFTDTSFSWWYNSEYKNYDVDVDALKPLFEDTTLTYRCKYYNSYGKLVQRQQKGSSALFEDYRRIKYSRKKTYQFIVLIEI